MSGFPICARCGAELTAPFFYNGKPYGHTCIEEIAPGAKKGVKPKEVVPIKDIKIDRWGSGKNSLMCKVEWVYVEGKRRKYPYTLRVNNEEEKKEAIDGDFTKLHGRHIKYGFVDKDSL